MDRKLEQVLEFYHRNYRGEDFGGELVQENFSSSELGRLKKVYTYGKYAYVEVQLYERGVLVKVNVTGEVYLFRNKRDAFIFARMRAERYKVLERGFGF